MGALGRGRRRRCWLRSWSRCFLLRDAGLPDLRRTVQAAGLWAPLLFVLLQAIVTVAPVPRTVFTVAAGVLFGSISGVLLTVTGTALAAATAYGLVRLVGGRFASGTRDRSRGGLGALPAATAAGCWPWCRCG